MHKSLEWKEESQRVTVQSDRGEQKQEATGWQIRASVTTNNDKWRTSQRKASRHLIAKGVGEVQGKEEKDRPAQGEVSEQHKG